jgi:hypothetical protein
MHEIPKDLSGIEAERPHSFEKEIAYAYGQNQVVVITLPDERVVRGRIWTKPGINPIRVGFSDDDMSSVPLNNILNLTVEKP